LSKKIANIWRRSRANFRANTDAYPDLSSKAAGPQPVVKVRLHSTSDASSRRVLLLRQIQAVFSVARCPRGASPVSVRRRPFTTGC